jgi:hypothetical protein
VADEALRSLPKKNKSAEEKYVLGFDSIQFNSNSFGCMFMASSLLFDEYFCHTLLRNVGNHYRIIRRHIADVVIFLVTPISLHLTTVILPAPSGALVAQWI